MEFDEEKVDDATLALLYLNIFRDGPAMRAWRGFDWETMNRLHQKGFIGDPKSKSKSVILTEDGIQRSEELFLRLFGKEAE